MSHAGGSGEEGGNNTLSHFMAPYIHIVDWNGFNLYRI